MKLTDKKIKERVLKDVMKRANLNQSIQMIVFDYILLPKHKRDGVEMANKIINLFNQY